MSSIDTRYPSSAFVVVAAHVLPQESLGRLGLHDYQQAVCLTVVSKFSGIVCFVDSNADELCCVFLCFCFFVFLFVFLLCLFVFGRLLCVRLCRQHVRRPFTRLLEVLGVTFLMTAVCFLMPMMWGACTPKPVDMEDWTEQVRLTWPEKQMCVYFFSCFSFLSFCKKKKIEIKK